MIAAALRGYWRRRGWLAWHIGMLGRVESKFFPKLHELTGEVRRAEAQSPDDMLVVLRRIKGAYGLKSEAESGSE